MRFGDPCSAIRALSTGFPNAEQVLLAARKLSTKVASLACLTPTLSHSRSKLQSSIPRLVKKSLTERCTPPLANFPPAERVP